MERGGAGDVGHASALPATTRRLEKARCIKCGLDIDDRYMMCVASQPWHAACLRCAACGEAMRGTCYFRNGEAFCKADYSRYFGTTSCTACGQSIGAYEMVQRTGSSSMFHAGCFACTRCGRKLNVGDEIYSLGDNRLACKEDYFLIMQAASSKANVSKRPRTTISAKQLEALKRTYKESPKPSRHAREYLSLQTGLDLRVVQVWFQNRRAKDKRLTADSKRSISRRSRSHVAAPPERMFTADSDSSTSLPATERRPRADSAVVSGLIAR